MTKKFKRLNCALSLLLAVIMAIGIVPVTALANSGVEMLKAEQTSTSPSLLNSLTIYTGYSLSKDTALLQTGNTYEGVAAFDPNTYSYTLPERTDALTQLRFRPVAAEEGATVTIYYYNNGSKDNMQMENSDSRSTWANCLTGGKNTFTLVVTPPEGSTNTKTTYTFTMDCYPTLTNLALAKDSSPLYPCCLI